MILWISAIGILLLIGLRVWSVWMDRPAEGVKKHFKKEMTRAVVEFLAILLSVTIGINFDEWQQDKQQKEQIMALLEVSVVEINGSYLLNNVAYQHYATLEAGESVSSNVAKTAQTMAKCNVITLEKILDMESVLATISPWSYNQMCVSIDSATNEYERLQTLDPETQGDAIGAHIKSVNACIEVLLYVIELEQGHLKGELTPSQMSDKFNERFVAGLPA